MHQTQSWSTQHTGYNWNQFASQLAATPANRFTDWVIWPKFLSLVFQTNFSWCGHIANVILYHYLVTWIQMIIIFGKMKPDLVSRSSWPQTTPPLLSGKEQWWWDSQCVKQPQFSSKAEYIDSGWIIHQCKYSGKLVHGGGRLRFSSINKLQYNTECNREDCVSSVRNGNQKRIEQASCPQRVRVPDSHVSLPLSDVKPCGR